MIWKKVVDLHRSMPLCFPRSLALMFSLPHFSHLYFPSSSPPTLLVLFHLLLSSSSLPPLFLLFYLFSGMEIEHMCENDSDIEFRSSNYNVLTTPRYMCLALEVELCLSERIFSHLFDGSIEYCAVVSGGRNVRSLIHGRVLRPLEYYGTFAEDG
jgi:hypothetical protein